MTERLSDEINQGLRIKDALYEKIERITVALVKRLEIYLKSDPIVKKDFSSFKKFASHFIDGGWSGITKAIFILNDGWTLELTYGKYVYLKNDKLDFLVKSGEYSVNTYNPPFVALHPTSVARLYELDRTLDQMLLDVYNRFTALDAWFNDLKVRG